MPRLKDQLVECVLEDKDNRADEGLVDHSHGSPCVETVFDPGCAQLIITHDKDEGQKLSYGKRPCHYVEGCTPFPDV